MVARKLMLKKLSSKNFYLSIYIIMDMDIDIDTKDRIWLLK